MLGYISIGVFIDGGYYAKVNRALKKSENSIIRVKSLFDFITFAPEGGIIIGVSAKISLRLLLSPRAFSTLKLLNSHCCRASESARRVSFIASRCD